MGTWGAYNAWSSPAIPYLTSNSSSFPITDIQGGWIISFYNLGDLLGGLINPLFIDSIGRKSTLLLFSLPGLVGWILIIFAENYVYLYIGRIIAGIGQGSTYNSLVIYLTEISEKNIRGILVNMIMISLSISVFVFTSIAAYTSYEVLNLISASLPVIFLLTFPFLPETPYYYLLRGRDADALKSLMKLRGISSPDKLDSDIKEIKLIIDENQRLKKSSFQELISDRCNRKGLMIMLSMKLTQQMSGMVAISSYAEEIFSYSSPNIKPGIQVMIITGVASLAALTTNIVIDRFMRRVLILFSGLVVSICLGSVGIFFFMDLQLEADVSCIKWLPLVALNILQVMYLFGIGTIPYIVQGEIFPINVKSAAVASGMIMGSTFAFGVSAGFKTMSIHAGIYTTFWFLAVFTFFGTFFTYWNMPETKGMTLEEIQAIQNPEINQKLALMRKANVAVNKTGNAQIFE